VAIDIVRRHVQPASRCFVMRAVKAHRTLPGQAPPRDNRNPLLPQLLDIRTITTFRSANNSALCSALNAGKNRAAAGSGRG